MDVEGEVRREVEAVLAIGVAEAVDGGHLGEEALVVEEGGAGVGAQTQILPDLEGGHHMVRRYNIRRSD